MADIPENLYTPTRDAEKQANLDSWVARHTSADPTRAVDVSPGSFPDVASEVIADMVMPLYGNQVAISKRWLIENTFGDDLQRLAFELLGDEEGLRLAATGATGFVEATQIVAGGASFLTTTTLRDPTTQVQLRVLVAGVYQDGDPIPVIGVTSGPASNLAALTSLQFESPPPGCSLTAKVLEQNDGTGTLVGLTGGRDAETDAELQQRLISAKQNPRAAGNSAQVVAVAQRTAGVPVQKAFTVTAWMGGGSTSVPFLIRPDANSTRIPNSTQRGLVEADLKNAFPADWTITVPSILAQLFSVALGVTWIDPARTWVDVSPWPEYVPADPVSVISVTNSLAMRVGTTATDTTTPVVGQTFALFDLAGQTFKRKRISAVSVVVANRQWDLTLTDALGASDAYEPAVGALLSPWSQSLPRLVSPIVAYSRTFGPGEQFASLPDPGERRRRWPFPETEYPSTVSNEGLVGAARASGAIADVEVLAPATPYATTVGVPGLVNYLLVLSDLAVFPQT